jgi:hypothetical protein
LNFWDHGWHYERGSGGCEKAFNVKTEFSFANAPTEGCARHAVVLSGPLEDIYKYMKKFEQHVINAAFGDVDVFIYATLTHQGSNSWSGGGGGSSSGSGYYDGDMREKQMNFLRSLKKGTRPYVMAAVIEEAANASTTNEV